METWTQWFKSCFHITITRVGLQPNLASWCRIFSQQLLGVSINYEEVFIQVALCTRWVRNQYHVVISKHEPCKFECPATYVTRNLVNSWEGIWLAAILYALPSGNDEWTTTMVVNYLFVTSQQCHPHHEYLLMIRRSSLGFTSRKAARRLFNISSLFRLLWPTFPISYSRFSAPQYRSCLTNSSIVMFTFHLPRNLDKNAQYRPRRASVFLGCVRRHTVAATVINRCSQSIKETFFTSE